jgi:DNA-binding NtrC family response regulator
LTAAALGVGDGLVPTGARVVCSGKRKKMAVILIVEDEPFIRDLASMLIEDWGHAVLTAGSVEEGLVILTSALRIDALFTDIRLSKDLFGGCDLAEQALALRPGLRVLYTTGTSATDAPKALFVVGGQFLGKPYSPHQLRNSVDGLLAA